MKNGVGAVCIKDVKPLVIIVDGLEEKAKCACNECEKK